MPRRVTAITAAHAALRRDRCRSPPVHTRRLGKPVCVGSHTPYARAKPPSVAESHGNALRAASAHLAAIENRLP